MWLCEIGVVILVAFLTVFIVEMRHDNSKIPNYERTLKEKIPYHLPILLFVEIVMIEIRYV